jgi:hypothetical protein
MVNGSTSPDEGASLSREAQEGLRIQGLVVTSLEGKKEPR